MTLDRATLNFLNAFPEDTRKEGERLQKQGAVRQIFGNHILFQGRVQESTETPCRPLLKFTEEQQWEADCSCRNGPDCSSIVATMLERVKRGESLPDAPNQIDDQSLTEILEERLGRSLVAFEDGFVDKLEKRYRRFETEGIMVDHDLVRLNAKWPVESFDPIQLWPVAPSNILEFWNYVAYHFRNRNLTYPKFMESVTDLSTVEDSMREWEQEKAEEQWRQTVCAFAEPNEPETLSVEFRFLLTTTEARLQWREAEKGAFATVSQAPDLARLRGLHTSGALRMASNSALVWETYLLALGESEHFTLRLEDLNHAAALNRVFHTGQTDTSLVNLDERPIVLQAGHVRWKCQEPASDEPVIDLQLFTPENEPIPHSVRLLPGQSPLYLADEAVFPGPPFWLGTTDVQPRYEIPRKVLWTEAGVAFLSGIGADLPPSLRDCIRQVSMGVNLRMRLSQKLTGSESEHLLVEVDAADPEGTRKEVLDKDGWIISERAPNPDQVIYRYDRDTLRLFPKLLDPMNVSWDPAKNCFRARITRSFPEKFVEWYHALPPQIVVETDEHLATLLADPVRATVTFDIVASEIDWFDLKIVVDVQGLNLTAAEIRNLVAARGGFVRMNDGGWLRLQIDLTEQQSEAVNRLGLDPFDLSGESHRMHVLQLAEPIAKEVFDEAAWAKICERSASLKLQVRPNTPQLNQLTLRPYQVEGFHFLSYLSTNGFGGILADDMGLGKTVQSIAWLLWLREKEERPALVVCPKSVLDVWAGEARKFAPHLRVQILRTKFELDMEDVAENVDILVLNYSQLRVNAEKLQSVRWRTIILDEGQQIKNPDSKAAKAARQLEADNRLVLTGTPIENRLLDIWSLMAFAMPGVLGNRRYFKERFDRRKDPRCQERLGARLRPFLLRRTKSQVAVDLPPRTEEDVLCKMDGVQEDLYKQELLRIQQMLLQVGNSDESFNRARFSVLQGLTRLRQICCHPALYDRAHGEAESAKFSALFYLLDNLREEGHKVLVFSQFVSMLEIIKERLEEEERPYLMLTGQTKDRQQVIEEFQTSKDPTVFLLSLKAGGTGLNLTAASYVVLYDPWWNPAVENQAIDRTHRIGQVNKVIAYRLLMRDSVEEKIRVLQQQKEAVAGGVLGEEGFAKSLTRDDLAFLFSGDEGV